MFRFAAREQLDTFTMGQSLASAAGHSSGIIVKVSFCVMIMVIAFFI